MQLQVFEFEWTRISKATHIFCIDLLRIGFGMWHGSLFMLYYCEMWDFDILYLRRFYLWLKYKLWGE